MSDTDGLIAHVATLTAELAAMKAERDAAPEKESERWAERFNFLHTEYGSDCSGTDSGDLLDLVEVEVRQALQKVEAERDAALKDAERYQWLRNPTNPVHKCYYSRGDFGRGLLTSTMLDAAIDAAREG